MHFLQILLWLVFYSVFYIIFSLNTLISLFFFMVLILFACLFLFYLQIEYLTYLILLLYLGGVLIFFLFTTLMLNKEFKLIKGNTDFSMENIILFLFFLKSSCFLTTFNTKALMVIQIYTDFYLPTLIENRFFFNNFISQKEDIFYFLSLYSEKIFFFIILGLLFLYVMIGSIIITHRNNV